MSAQHLGVEGPQAGAVDLEASIASLEVVLSRLGRVVVAFSGGADSTFLAAAANRHLGGEAVHCVTAASASLAPWELDDCAALAGELDLRWTAFPTDELEDAAYSANGLDRCYRCKTELMSVVVPLCTSERAVGVLGVNLDDLNEHRPGQRAALEAGAMFPLVEAGFTKAMVREGSRRLGLRTADKPAAACLASRVPHGTPVTLEVLGRVAKAESVLRRLGFRELRVRHYGTSARIELALDELPAALAHREAIVAGVRSAGYSYVTIDLEGLRSGNLSPVPRPAPEERPPGEAGSPATADVARSIGVGATPRVRTGAARRLDQGDLDLRPASPRSR